MAVFPQRMGFLSMGMTRSLIARDKKYAPHPATGKPVLVTPTVFVQFRHDRPLFLDDKTVKYEGFGTLREFFQWLKSRGEIEKGEILYSACLGEPMVPVAMLGKDDVEKELRRRMMRPEKEAIGGSADEKASALLQLRVVAGESVAEPRLAPAPVDEKVQADPSIEDRLTSEVLTAARR